MVVGITLICNMSRPATTPSCLPSFLHHSGCLPKDLLRRRRRYRYITASSNHLIDSTQSANIETFRDVQIKPTGADIELDVPIKSLQVDHPLSPIVYASRSLWPPHPAMPRDFCVPDATKICMTLMLFPLVRPRHVEVKQPLPKYPLAQQIGKLQLYILFQMKFRWTDGFISYITVSSH